jgi:hypothetical protein
MTTTMQRREREDLEKMSRDRERLAKAAADARAAELKANFEEQMAAQYSWDQDPVWKEAHALAAKATNEAEAAIKAQCAKLGIPPEFAPGLSLGWHGRGENAIKERRSEMRKVAYTRIESMVKDAKTKIGLACCEYRVKLMSGSLQSEEAKAFLESMPTVADLMPKLSLPKIQHVVDKAAEAYRQRWLS